MRIKRANFLLIKMQTNWSLFLKMATEEERRHLINQRQAPTNRFNLETPALLINMRAISRKTRSADWWTKKEKLYFLNWMYPKLLWCKLRIRFLISTPNRGKALSLSQLLTTLHRPIQSLVPATQHQQLSPKDLRLWVKIVQIFSQYRKFKAS